jgi:hypothetical protein
VRRVSEQLGAVPMVHISPPGIQDAYNRLSAQGLSGYSVLQAHRTLHRARVRAFHWGLMSGSIRSGCLPFRLRAVAGLGLASRSDPVRRQELRSAVAHLQISQCGSQ